PKLCKHKAPPGAKSWTQYADRKISGKDCTAVGFPRIFTEHASGVGNASNPDHVFELHPLTSLSCPGVQVNFRPYLRVQGHDAAASSPRRLRPYLFRRIPGRTVLHRAHI